MSKGSFTYGGQANVNMQEIAFSIYTAVDSAFYDVEYPEHDWYKVVKEDQVLSDINAGATQYAFISRDRQGAAAFRGQAENNNIPMVSQTAGSSTVPLCASNVGAKIDNEDARQYQMGFNGNLAQDLGECMRFACDNLVERTVFFGDDAVGFKGFMNFPGVTTSTAASGAAGGTEWSKKTAAEMVKDITDGLATVWTNSRGVFLPNTVFLPLEQFNLLAVTPYTLGASAAVFQSALDYVKKYNIYTNQRGKELEIIPIRYLKNANKAGTAGRMILQDRSKRNQALPFPMGYTLQAPVPVPLGAEFYSEQKHGSYVIRQPLSTLYVDGI